MYCLQITIQKLQKRVLLIVLSKGTVNHRLKILTFLSINFLIKMKEKFALN